MDAQVGCDWWFAQLEVHLEECKLGLRPYPLQLLLVLHSLQRALHAAAFAAVPAKRTVVLTKGCPCLPLSQRFDREREQRERIADAFSAAGAQQPWVPCCAARCVHSAALCCPARRAELNATACSPLSHLLIHPVQLHVLWSATFLRA